MILTTGVSDPPSTPIARQEICTFSSPLSWFQVAGIHGRPYIAYDEVAGVGTLGGYSHNSSILFYIWHRPYLALFEQTLSKHMVDIANEFTIASDKKKYTAAAQKFRLPYWDWALNADLPEFIASQTLVNVNTPKGPRTMNNPLYGYKFNPVYSNFGDGLPDEKKWESWSDTLRWPNSTDESAESDPSKLRNALHKNRALLRDSVYNLLTLANTYQAFSNDGSHSSSANGSPRCFEGLSSVSGIIHGLVGGGGHMGVVDYCAFDPVFWLLHCNCDRILAIWQTLNPQEYVLSGKNEIGTFTTVPGTIEAENSSLQPFRKTETEFWTATSVSDIQTFNYTYPELIKWVSLPEDQKSVQIRTDVNSMYGKTAVFPMTQQEWLKHLAPSGPAAFMASVRATASKLTMAVSTATTKAARRVSAVASPLHSRFASADKDAPKVPDTSAASTSTDNTGAVKKTSDTVVPVPPNASNVHEVPSAPVAPVQETRTDPVDMGGVDIKTKNDKKHYNEWLANIVVEKYAAKKTFWVYIFIGDLSDDPTKWGEDPNLVGTHIVFTNNMDAPGFERTRDAAEVHKLVTGTIPLTGALGDRLGKDKIGNLEPAEIVPYLKKNLHWRIQDQDGNVIETKDIPSLKISVARISVALPDDIASFPTWGAGQVEQEVTIGRPGGVSEAGKVLRGQ